MKQATAYLTDALDATVETRVFKFDPLYSGGPAYIDGFDYPCYVDLSTLQIDPAPKALLEHDPNAVVGKLENIKNNGETITCDAVVGGTTLAAKVIEWAEHVADWVPSIGVYRIDDRDVEFVPEGAGANVNNQSVVGPAYICHGGSLCEGSFVAIGGDGSARSLLAKLWNEDMTKRRKLFVKAAEGVTEPTEETIVETPPVEEIEALVEEKVAEETDAIAEEAIVDAVEENSEEILEEIVVDAVDQAAEVVDTQVGEEIVTEIVDEILTEIEEEAPVDTTDALAVAKFAVDRAKKKLKARASRRTGRRAAAALAEQRRVAGLKALATGKGKGVVKIIATAISEGWSVPRTSRIIDASNKRERFVAGLRNPGRNATEGGRAPSKQDILTASLAQTLGMSPKRIQSAFKFDQRVIDAAQDRQYRGATLRTIVAESNNSFNPGSFGVNTSMLTAWNECRDNCRRARIMAGAGGRSIQANAGFSTISATDVFTLVLQAFLEPSQETAPKLYSEITRTNTLADFNTVSSYLPTLQGRLREISETGAIQNITFTTEKFDRATKANGINFTIPEMVIINDQIDVFAELLRQFETLGDDCIEHDVAEMFWRILDGDAKDGYGNPIVSAARGNYITNASLDENGLNDALVALNSYSTANGVPLSVDNAIMLTGSKLGATAMKLYAQEYVDFANGTVTPNIYRGRFRPLVWPYLDKAHARAVTDTGTTSLLQGEKTWALIRDPATRPVVCVNKLVGYESPQIRQFDYDPAVWGITYQLIYPYSVSAQYADGIVALTNA